MNPFIAFRLAYSVMRSKAISLTLALVFSFSRLHASEPSLLIFGIVPSLPVNLAILWRLFILT